MKISIYPHEQAAKVIFILSWINVVFAVLFGIFVGIPIFNQPNSNKSGFFFYLTVLFGIALFLYFVQKGIRNRKNWAKTAALVYSFLLLLAVPIGTIFGIYILKKLKNDYPLEKLPDEDEWR